MDRFVKAGAKKGHPNQQTHTTKGFVGPKRNFDSLVEKRGRLGPGPEGGGSSKERASISELTENFRFSFKQWVAPHAKVT